MHFVDFVIEQFNADRKAFWPHEVSFAIYSAANQRHLTENQQRLVEMEAAAWDLHLREEPTSCWGTHFAPSHLPSCDGRILMQPDLANMGVMVLATWTSRLEQVTHPILLSRYADVLWSTTTVIAPTQNPDYRVGEIAVDAYIRTVEEKLSLSDIDSALKLQRALQIALDLRDDHRVTVASEKLLILAASADLLHVGVWSMPSRVMRHKRRKHLKLYEDMVRQLESRLAEAALVDNGYAANAACKALLEVYTVQSHLGDRRRVILQLAETYRRQAEVADPNIAISWLMPIAQLLQDEGLKDEAANIRLIIEKRGPEAIASLTACSVEIPISIPDLDKTIKEIISVAHPYTALLRLSSQLIPKCERLRKQVMEHERDFLYFSLAPRVIIGNDGLPIATIGSSKNDLSGRLIEEAGLELKLGADIFARGYQAAKDKFTFTVSDIVDVIATSPLVPAGVDKLLKESVEAFEKGDFAKTISTLVPQIEAMLRELLRLLGVPVKKSLRDGMLESKNMSDVLRDASVEEALEEDLLFFLRTVYVDKRSFNLRNEAMHGLLPPSGYNQMTASLTIISLILLGAINDNCVYLISEKESGSA